MLIQAMPAGVRAKSRGALQESSTLRGADEAEAWYRGVLLLVRSRPEAAPPTARCRSSARSYIGDLLDRALYRDAACSGPQVPRVDPVTADRLQ